MLLSLGVGGLELQSFPKLLPRLVALALTLL